MWKEILQEGESFDTWDQRLCEGAGEWETKSVSNFKWGSWKVKHQRLCSNDRSTPAWHAPQRLMEKRSYVCTMSPTQEICPTRYGLLLINTENGTQLILSVFIDTVSFLFSVFNMSWTVHAQEKLDSPHDEGPRLSQTTCGEFSLPSLKQTFNLHFCIQCWSLKVSVKIMFYLLVSRVSQNLLNSDRAACARSSQTSRRKAVCVRGVRPSSLESKRPADAHQSYSQVAEHVYICQWFPTSRTCTPGYLLQFPGGPWKDCRLSQL